ncbi:peptidase M20, dimerization domain-containing protein [Lasiosphaeria miniovina]|uniref:Peptidase M20, dimerization domain-containing protein n=1 Tax=Lasiosphaeria miniovina TaxID=1954250 RepID=A0AA40B381_9PEZI|nr:peptidase M20, dimerization domain-containing protein [Lasiosphaeria miniovina]KAK0726821.1 peptidase M20, dimerization domain-containing protein [Lasiosphaeria miniovina]
MVEDGLYEKVHRPDIVLGQHIVNDKAGTFQIGSSYALAGKRTFRIIVHGRGGHSSAPQGCVDPVIIAYSVVLKLQTIVSREVDPRETVVVTCSSIHAGNSPNAIPDTAELTVDVRAYSVEVFDKIVESVKRIVKAESEASGVLEEPTIDEIEHFKAIFGSDALEAMVPDMASDDFSILAPEGTPYAYWTLGSTCPDMWDRYQKEGRLNELPANHSPLFAPAIQPTLSLGIDSLAIAALTFLLSSHRDIS